MNTMNRNDVVRANRITPADIDRVVKSKVQSTNTKRPDGTLLRDIAGEMNKLATKLSQPTTRVVTLTLPSGPVKMTIRESRGV